MTQANLTVSGRARQGTVIDSAVNSITLQFHAEKLHDDRVWKFVQKFALRLHDLGIRATYFVYPFRARVAGCDITRRIQWLGALGNEIAQHTHFYAGDKINVGAKKDDLSQQNIAACMSRDFAAIKQAGFTPKGFTAGAWLVNQSVWDALIDLGFEYDCSAQYPNPTMIAPLPNTHWLKSPEYYGNRRNQILCLPVTCSVGEWFKWGRRTESILALPHKLFYLHDYDLLSLRTRALLTLLLRTQRHRLFQPSGAVAQSYRYPSGAVPGLWVERDCDEPAQQSQ